MQLIFLKGARLIITVNNDYNTNTETNLLKHIKNTKQK